jgi:GNAT superfamily N-acetyltransferase
MDVRISPCVGPTLRARLADFVDLLRDGVDGGASMSFIAPLDAEQARRFWGKVAGEVETGRRLVLGAFEGQRLVGSVQLSLDMPPNQPHRVDLQKMLVHSAMRRRGLGRQLLAAADDAVRAAGRSLIVLDTVRGSDAESVYARCGYTRVGVIPGFALNHDGSALADTVIFYRQL